MVATEDAAAFELRMKNAAEEMAHWRDYSHVLVSGSRVEDAARELQRSQRHDPEASQRQGQAVAPVDARQLPLPGQRAPAAAGGRGGEATQP